MNTAGTWALVSIAVVCLVTVAVGSVGLRVSRTTSDFYVASRLVTPGWNASAISGEYLSVASFLGVAGLVYALGTEMLWLPVGYTVGYLVLLVLVAAPLRRSGAYTIPDFAELRLQSHRVRTLSSVLVVAIGWLYLLPQFQGAGLTLSAVTGLNPRFGAAVVAVVVLLSVAAGGMRSITLVQAMQYWLKLTALAIPAMVLVWWWARQGSPMPPIQEASATSVGGPFSGAHPAYAPREHAVYATYSTILALCFGTMGLPHVLVRFYTNPDGRSARRATLIVLVMLGSFYLFPPIFGILGRVYLPALPAGVGADAVTLLLPSQMIPGPIGELLSAILAGGAFAALLSTSSGLAVSVAGVIDQDLFSGRLNRRLGGDLPRVHSFRLATAVAVLIPYAASLLSPRAALADTVGMAFTVAASTFCPLLILGVWWRGLSVAGALSGLLVGGITATAATSATFFQLVPNGADPWVRTLLAQPAAWTMPLAFTTAVLVSLATPRSVPRGAARVLVRLHAPEDVA